MILYKLSIVYTIKTIHYYSKISAETIMIVVIFIQELL